MAYLYSIALLVLVKRNRWVVHFPIEFQNNIFFVSNEHQSRDRDQEFAAEANAY